jgi:c-di-GMP-binding flagellar brake protein YcgR
VNNIGKNRRTAVRFKSPFYIRYSCQRNSENCSAIAKDVSMKGVKLLLDSELDLEAKDKLSLNCLLPRRCLTVKGEVKWTKTYSDRKEAGILFTNIPDHHKQEIHDYIYEYYPQELTRRWWRGLK